MKKFFERADLDTSSLSSVSLNTLLAEEIDEESGESVMEVGYRPLSSSYYNNRDHIACLYFKDIVISDGD